FDAESAQEPGRIAFSGVKDKATRWDFGKRTPAWTGFGIRFAIQGCHTLPCPSNSEEEAMAGMEWPRRLPVGAEVLPDHGVHFRVWAPRRQRVAVVLEGGTDYRLDNYALTVELTSEGNGYFSGQVAHAQAGSL